MRSGSNRSSTRLTPFGSYSWARPTWTESWRTLPRASKKQSLKALKKVPASLPPVPLLQEGRNVRTCVPYPRMPFTIMRLTMLTCWRSTNASTGLSWSSRYFTFFQFGETFRFGLFLSLWGLVPSTRTKAPIFFWSRAEISMYRNWVWIGPLACLVGSVLRYDLLKIMAQRV